MRNHFDGERFRQLRKQRGLSVTDIADKIRVHKATIYRYEKEEIEPSARTVQVLANVLYTNTEYLMGNTENSDKDDKSELSMDGIMAIRMGIQAEEVSRIVHAFQILNESGRHEALKRIEELAELKAYTERERKEYGL